MQPIRRAAGSLGAMARSYSPMSDLPQNKVAIVGANGGLGQPLALMLKRSSFVVQLALHDLEDTRGLCADLSHISTKASVQSYVGKEQLQQCLSGSSLVVMVAGTARRPGMHREDLFDLNAGSVAEVADAVAQHCPKAHLCLLTSPVNSNVPLAAEILKRRGAYDPRRLFGITALDSVRANVLLAQLKGVPLHTASVPVVGGHSAGTIVPLLSQAAPRCRLQQEEILQLNEAVAKAADNVVEAKAGRGSATLSVAAAAHSFLESLLVALDGRQNVVAPAYVQSNDPEVKFFSNRLLLGRHGIAENLGVGDVSSFEAELIEKAKELLRPQIEKGEQFARQWS